MATGGHHKRVNARLKTRYGPPLRNNGRQTVHFRRCRTLDHSALMLAARITLPHFSVSSTMRLLKSAGEPDITLPPSSASRVLIVGSASTALIALLSFSTISAGVFLEAPTPF